ncbi:MAG: glycerophosphodiester phosphodiesterase family protein, partial [Planctomycetota bacterium]
MQYVSRWTAGFCAVLALACGGGCANALRAPSTLIVAHRGASEIAPENTLAAFELAWAAGADGIEGDFFQSRDGVIVAHHDRTTKRTSGVDRGVRDQTYAELAVLDVGRWKSSQYEGERIPTLYQVMRTVPPGGRIFIEIKDDVSIVEPLARALETTTVIGRSQMTVIAFDAETLGVLHRRLRWLDTLWLTGFEQDAAGAWTPGVEEVIATAHRIGANGVDVEANASVVDQAFVDAVHAQGLELHIWTVNDPDA